MNGQQHYEAGEAALQELRNRVGDAHQRQARAAHATAHFTAALAWSALQEPYERTIDGVVDRLIDAEAGPEVIDPPSGLVIYVDPVEGEPS